MNDIEEPIQEVVLENALESGVDMFDDFSMLDEKLPEKENSINKWGLAGSLNNVVRRMKSAEGDSKVCIR